MSKPPRMIWPVRDMTIDERGITFTDYPPPTEAELAAAKEYHEQLLRDNPEYARLWSLAQEEMKLAFGVEKKS